MSTSPGWFGHKLNLVLFGSAYVFTHRKGITMASYKVEKLPSQPIVLFTAAPNYVLGTDLEPSIREAIEIINRQSEPVYYIQDLQAMKIMDFDEVLTSAYGLTHGDTSLYHHPKIKRVLGVTTDEVLKQAFAGLHHALFGDVDALVFDTLDEAIAYALEDWRS
jgi:hypothetical protein